MSDLEDAFVNDTVTVVSAFGKNNIIIIHNSVVGWIIAMPASVKIDFCSCMCRTFSQ